MWLLKWDCSSLNNKNENECLNADTNVIKKVLNHKINWMKLPSYNIFIYKNKISLFKWYGFFCLF